MAAAPRSDRRRRIHFVVAVALVLAPRPALAACNPGICVGTPTACTITGTNDIDGGCVLAFTGKAVTLAQGAVLRAAATGAFEIRAKSFNQNGTLRAPGGSIALKIDDDFTMSTMLSSQIETDTGVQDTWGDVLIEAGGAATVRRIVTNGVGYGGDVEIVADSITVRGPIQANGDVGGWIRLEARKTIDIQGDVSANGTGAMLADGGSIELFPDGDLRIPTGVTVQADGVRGGGGGDLWMIVEGNATVGGTLTANGAGPDGWGGSITLDAAALTYTGSASADGGSGASATGGLIDLSAGQGALAVSGGPMNARADTGGHGGDFFAQGLGDVTLAGTYNMTGAGMGSTGGHISAEAGLARTLTVSGTLDARATTVNGAADGGIFLSACTVNVTGVLRAQQHPQGRVDVRYRSGFTAASGAQILAGSGPTGGNHVTCRCTGLDPVAATCSATTCAPSPVVTGATVSPPLTQHGTLLGPCTGCGNGIKESGEACDDGNFDRTDGCHNCRVCGDGSVDAGAGEQCDDKNRLPGDCCSPSCLFEPGGSPCDDAQVCTTSSSCSNGKCLGTAGGGCGVVLVLDTSYGMDLTHDGHPTTDLAQRRITKAKEASYAFVNMLNRFAKNKARLGAFTFPTQHTVIFGNRCRSDPVQFLSTIDDTIAAQVNDAIRDLHTHFTAPLLDGVSDAAAELASEPETQGARAMLLLSMGYQECPDTIGPTDKETQAVIDLLKATQTRLFAVGFGNPADVDTPFLSALTDATTPPGAGSQLYKVTEPDLSAWDPATALQETFKTVLTSALDLDNVVDPRDVISAGETQAHPVSINPADTRVGVFLGWATPQANRLSLTVRASDGVALDPNDDAIHLDQGDTFTILTVDAAALRRRGRVSSAAWSLEIGAGALPAGTDENYQYGVIVESAIKMRAQVLPLAPRTGNVLTMTARITNGGVPVTGLTDVTVQVTRPEEGIGNWFVANAAKHAPIQAAASAAEEIRLPALSRRALELRDVLHVPFPDRLLMPGTPLFDDGTHGDTAAGDGVYTNELTDVRKEGTYGFYFAASGSTAAGSPWRRERYQQSHVAVSVSSAASRVRLSPGKGRLLDVNVVPQDVYGNYLGPGRGGAVSLSASHGEFVDPIVDNLDGTYRRTLQVPRGVAAKQIRVDAGAAGAACQPARCAAAAAPVVDAPARR